ncbi:MAG: Clp protease N-terminal domain-containing protein [Nitrolancea sp.]
MLNIEAAVSGVSELPMTGEVRAALMTAERTAKQYGHELVTVEHVLLALLDPPGVPLRILFTNLRVDAAKIMERLRAVAEKPEFTGGVAPGIHDDVAFLLDYAAGEAARAGDVLVNSTHVLTGIAAQPGTAIGRLLNESGLTATAIRKGTKVRRQATSTGVRGLLSAIQVSPLFLLTLGVMFASGALLYFMPYPRADRALIAVFLISGWVAQLCVHEFGHAAAAFLGGDTDVVDRGYLTLDPRRYTHPLLSIVMPLVFLFMGGLPLPGGAVRINTQRRRSRRWDVIVSAAGPAGTLVFLLIISLPFLVTGNVLAYGHNVDLSGAVAGLGVVLAATLLLNLLPIPPLDGFQILAHWLPEDIREQGYRLGFMPMIVLFVLMGHSTQINDGFWNAAETITNIMRLPFDLGTYFLWLIHV